MQKVSILIPTRQRYKKLDKCLKKLFENTVYPDYEVVVITDRDDPKSTELVANFHSVSDIYPLIEIIVKDKREMYVGKINESYHKTTSPLIVFLADDVEVQKNWLVEAVKVFDESFPDKMGLVSFQDEFDTMLAPHGLISRKYVEEFLNGNIFYPGYVHYWCDTELTVRSKGWNRFVHSPKSVTIHRSRPEIDRHGEDDDHIRKEARTTLEQGEELLVFRQCWGFPDKMPEMKNFELPSEVDIRFMPSEELEFYVGFGVDTRKKLNWRVDRETALFFLKRFPGYFQPIIEKKKTDSMSLPGPISKLKVLAIICAYNEMDILPYLLDHLKEQGISVFVFDNCSTDGTWEYLMEKGIDCEKLDTHEQFNLARVIEAKLKKWDEVIPDWCIHQDADEFPLTREFRTLRELIEDRDRKGFDVINQLRVTFLPTGKEDFGKKDPRKIFRYYDKDYWFSSMNACSDRIFKYKRNISLEAHDVPSSMRRSSEGLDNVIFHYPYREFAEKRMEERRFRSLKTGCKGGVHGHYFDPYPKGFIWEKEGKGDLRNPKDPLYKFYEKWEEEETKKIVKSIQGWVGDKEGAYLFQRAKDCSKGIIVEIGSWKGMSTVWLGRGSKAGNKTRIYAIDPFDGRDSKFITMPRPNYSVFEIFKDNIRKAGLDGLITPIVSRSQDASDKIKERIEFLFVDGAHGYEFVKKDWELYSPKVIRGGIIVFHDANEKGGVKREGVVKLMRELSEDKRVEKIDVVGSMVVWRKV